MKYLKHAIIILFILTGLNSAKASHMVGADITYKCLDAQGNYRVTLVFYRDCAGIPTCSGNCSAIGNCTKTMEVRGNDATYNGTVFFTFNVAGKSVKDIYLPKSESCTNAKTICSNMGCAAAGSLTPGIERYEFEGTVNIGSGSSIPSACCSIVFSFQECCRNGAIQNISPQSFYTEAQVNRCLATYPNCNSPVFSNDPYYIVCSGQGFYYNFGGYDPDFDSLSYSFSPALYNYGVNATYSSPYTYNEPMPYTQPQSGNFPYGIRVDAYGSIQFKPSIYPFTGIVVIKIDQWRKINNVYTKIGTTQRDMQLYIKFCSDNKPPWFVTTPSGNPPNVPLINYIIKPDSQFCFTVMAKDSDFNYPTLSDTTYLSWNNLLASYGATFIPNYNAATRATNGPREDSYSVCWRPNDSAVRAMPYQFNITGFDNRCPYPGIRSQQFNIKVIEGAKPIAIYDTVKCQAVTISHGSLPVALSYKMWKISRTPGYLDTSNMIISTQQSLQLSHNKAGRYPYQLSIVEAVSGLARTFVDTFEIKREVSINNDTSFCGSNISLNLKLTKFDSAFIKYRWYGLPNIVNAIDTNREFTLLISTNKSILLRAYDSISTCFYADTVNVKTGRIRASISMITDAQQCLINNQFKFKNTSVDSAGNALFYLWTFENGDTTSKKDSIVKSFPATGEQQVKLLAYNAFGCIDSTIQTLHVFSSPTAAFTLLSDSSQCMKGNNYAFVNGSTVADDTLHYTWKPGKGSEWNTENLTISYDSAGLYTIKLIAITNHQCKDSIVKQVKVQPQVKVGFIIDDTTQCLIGNSFALTDTSKLASGSYSRLWLFGDSSSDTAKSTTHSYANLGTYPVTLITTTNQSCRDTLIRNVHLVVKPVPLFTINDSSQCLIGNTFMFTNQSSIGSSDSLWYTWSFGDNAGSVSMHATHSYTATGTYQVKLYVKSSSTCDDSISRQVIIHPQPIAQFSFTDNAQCLGSNQFKPINQSGGGPLNYSWDMGDSTVYTDSSITHHYNRIGNFMVQLIAKSNQACSDTASMVVHVNPNPKAEFFILDSSEQCYAVNRFKFMDQSLNDSGSYSTMWYFGDGTFTSDTNPVKSYLIAGNYMVKLVTTSSQNCKDSSVKAVKVYKTPQASFQMPDSTQCIGSVFVFNNTSINTGDSIVDYIWSTGDSTIIHATNTSYTYPQPGNYLAALVVVNQDSCYAIAKRQIVVYPKPHPVISGDSVAPQKSIRTYTSPFSSGSAWNWMISGDSSHNSNGNGIQIIWSSQDSGLVALTELNVNNCLSDTVYRSVKLTPPVGVTELINHANHITVYPQPADNKLFLLGDIQELRSAELISMEGKLIRAFNAEEISSGSLDMQMIQSGMYLMQFNDVRNNILVQKVSIVK